MHVDEKDVGDFRVYGAAIKGEDGYTSAIAIARVKGAVAPIEVFRDEQLAAPHVWEDADQALHFAMKVGQRVAEAWSGSVAHFPAYTSAARE